MATKIILDPGHGGYDAGASYEGRREKDDVLNLAFDVAANLRRLGYDVEFTRVEDVYDSPTEKARIANASGADFFVSLHRNSSATPNQYEGVETLLYSDTGIKADMARNINSRLEDVGFKNLGVDVRRDLAVLRRTNMPALLLEVGFINNVEDNELFDTRAAQIAEAIALGIDETLRTGTTTAMNSGGFVNDFYGYETNIPVFAAEGMWGMDENDPDDMVTESRDGMLDDFGDDMMEQPGQIQQRPGMMEQSSQLPVNNQVIYQILVSIFRSIAMANFKMNQLLNSGFDATANEVDGLYQVRVGAFDTIEEAMRVQQQLRDRGYETLIVTYEDGEIR